MNYFTKWPEIYPTPNQEAFTVVAEVLFENWMSILCAQGDHSDQGKNFDTEVFQNMCRLFNRTRENFLSIAINENQTNWDTCIPPFLLAYRSAMDKLTGKTPASVVFGAELRLPIEVISERQRKKKIHLQDRLKLIHAEVRQKLESDRIKTRYNLRANTVGFQVCEKVCITRREPKENHRSFRSHGRDVTPTPS
ncbi:hypothetical protein NQ315_006150 [Exocentrus adspersus]|uniref:Integrase catalytic domain-containing protein n=1 Tax=Exocentrus adspersus TaxID=1586481 RepID=A0AAV8VDG8_9CUCU|nr:hypothetical protein NQ315_006150 [Exocentrus adspersus]